MKLFDRRVNVIVGPEGGEGVRVDERFHIEFNVSQTVGQETNRMDCTIYGLRKETRERFQEPNQILQIEAGHGDRTEVLAIGDITRVEVQYSLPEIRTVIEAGDGARALRDRRVSLSFAAGATVDRVLNRIAEELALARRATGVEITGVYQEGVSFSGTAKEALEQATRKAGLTWSIQNRELQILDRVEASQSRGPLLTPETGLLDSPSPLEESGEENERRRGTGYEVRSILNPKIRPGERIVVDSRDIPRAQFRVDTVVHKGATRGNDWITTAEAFADE